MARLKNMIAAMTLIAAACAPVAVSAAGSASKLSLVGQVKLAPRVGTVVHKSNHLEGGSGVILALATLALVGIVVLVTQKSKSP